MRLFCLKHYIGDGVVSVVLALMLICVSVLFAVGNNDNTKVRILRDGKEEGVFDLSQNRSCDIDGVHIEIKDGRAYIHDSDCPDKVCMTMQGVAKNGGGAVCIPNRIVLEPTAENTQLGSDVIAG